MPPAAKIAEILRCLRNGIPSVAQPQQEQVEDLLGRDLFVCIGSGRGGWLRCKADRNRVILRGNTVDKLFERIGRFGAVYDNGDRSLGRRRLLGRGGLREENESQEA